ncbi:hypothetical protein ONZ43_g987 [Nemania bipapillata]|uniref:Uncharacterized protein n=1 Tax=Nemania bipapillata TaxID=110536 RepID=A0ACC2J691_9PEZI|nr:hypothetical protein ONZ43_g987 [Nemania bipapillata]
MTSSLPKSVFEGLGDVREKYTDETSQNFILSRTYPVAFNAEHITQAPSYQRGREFKFNTHLDAAVVVLRHLYSMVAPDYRSSDCYPDEESRCPLLRFIWADFRDTSEASLKAQCVIRYEMQLADDPEGQASIFKLFENKAMWDTLWSRMPFRLYHDTVLGKAPRQKKWKCIDHHESIIQHTLVKWDGTKPLGDYIGGHFGHRKFDDGDEMVYIFNNPAIIRVRYQHKAQAQGPAKYADIRQIYIKHYRFKHEERDGDHYVVKSKSEERKLYTLVAVVRCSNDGREGDRIRLYSMIGSPLSLPIGLEEYVGTYWNLGDLPADRPYLLFYARAPPEPITGLHEEPIARRPADAEALINSIIAGSTRLNTKGGPSASTTKPTPPS